MAIVKMEKFNLISFKENRQSLLKKLQNFNYVHLNDLKEDEEEKYIKEVKNSVVLSEIDAELSKNEYILKLLGNYKEKDSLSSSLKKEIPKLSIEEINKTALNFNFDLVYNELKRIDELKNQEINKKNNLENPIKELYPWKSLDIKISQLDNFKYAFAQKGRIQNRYYEEFMNSFNNSNLQESVIEKISTVDDFTYMIAISTIDEKDSLIEFLKENGFSNINLKIKEVVKDKLDELYKEKETCEKEIEKYEEQLKEACKYIPDFEIYQAYLINLRRKEESGEFFLNSKKFDIIEGFIPQQLKEDFVKALDEILENDYSIDFTEAEKEDPDVPVMLKNGKFSKSFENITKMYSLPKYSEIDPTPLFAPFYMLFAGIMVGDLGYGILLTLGCIFAIKFLHLSKSVEESVKMFFWVGLSTSFWGIIFGSAFGFELPYNALITPSEDYMTLITLALILGGIHLFFGLGIKGYMYIRDGHFSDFIYDVVFWYMAVGGAIAFGLSKVGILPEFISKISLILMIIGMVGIVLFSGRENKSIAPRLLWGLYDLYGISGWIGDFVSYLRLMALVLSGGFIALAVNIITGMMFKGGIIGMIGAIVIFCIFQAFNMFLSYLSAYVHTARLIYVEMFNKFYEGGGKAFREMLKDTKFIYILKGEKL
ncbi:MAG: V-type ATP synthase subunit I [Peptoniphilaceae bacterium]|nr:V-type ATP synthase subunit I [Peptoniphilaceae bacterium]MDY3738645.1 V-type ATP synthase subunit I [Peptoniphilaceae bacterium]